MMAAAMSSVAQSGMQIRQRPWDSRIHRVRELQEQHAPAAAVLRFYEKVLEFQRDVAASSYSVIDSGLPLREQVDLEFAASKVPAILSLTIQSAPDALVRKAESLQQTGKESWHATLRSTLLIGASELELDATDAFLARACLQPMMENLQSQLPVDPNYQQSVCPACGGYPQAAVLRPEGDGARRWLLCSLCLREWVFRRVVCPWCGEEDKEKLPRYTAEECAHVRVEGCDTCRRYLKSVDLTLDGRAVPLADEVALAVLDVWAVEHGYTKIVPNLMGF
jgi:FdhE protein